MSRQSRVVVHAVDCPTCKRRCGQHCVFRTGPCERIGKPLKECHPERMKKAQALAKKIFGAW